LQNLRPGRLIKQHEDNMKKSIFIFFIAALVFVPVMKAQDERAGKILDRLFEGIQSAPSVWVDFTISISSPRDNFSDEMDGEMIMKGDKYRLSIMDMETWFDGTSIHTYMADANEVMISDPDDADGGLMTNPARLFSIYSDEFKYRLTGELNRDGKRLYEIDLHPKDREQEFHTMKLFIDRDGNFIHSAVIAARDGNIYTFTVNNFNRTKQMPDSHFVFRTEDYPGVEVIDMRW
jgi:outer membrane lipoprotein-sorting protein